jgi:hypothetical protein
MVGRQIGINVGDVNPTLVPDMPVHQFVHLFSMKDDRLLGQYAIASV